MSQSGEGGTRTVTCARYDFEKVYVTYVAIIDALTATFGGSVVGVRRAGTDRFAWPSPGKAKIAQFWNSARGFYDVVDEPAIHILNGLAVEAYLLGKDWCVMDTSTGQITTRGGKPPEHLGSMPLIRVCGKETGPQQYTFPTTQDIALFEAAIGGIVATEGLKFEKSQPEPIPGTDLVLQTAAVGFPHAKFGAGMGPQRVRCVDTNGKELLKPN